MSQNLLTANHLLTAVNQTLNQPCSKLSENQKLKAGIDLGTSSIVLVVLDESNEPIVCLSEEAEVIKDGLIVNFSETVQIVRRLKQQAEAWLERPLLSAAGAIPPQTFGNNKKAVGHVIEAAEIEATQIFDEPEAAAAVLRVANGAVIDIGGGTTGISIFEKGRPVYSADEPTGGHHMSLVLAGSYQVDLAQSETIKRDPAGQAQNFQILRPVVEKMATITHRFLMEYGKPVESLYLVGGATMFPQFEKVFETITGVETFKPVHPRYVTPTGIAMLSQLF
ncbi:ethanolamine utilization protein EutJ [Enterococcus florum]|uniref:Chaperone protein DnaK n=1 Tax=Enterococcus florum TaxID=2480627 RepID=A0A4P5P6U3_9ENTE|nr:ethanolamine utilization protein EutJ [Enterococcus florum]GCF93136.1 ethanolamine utilization protein EutJ [Enterococcus florum]